MTDANPVVAALPGQGWQYVVRCEDDEEPGNEYGLSKRAVLAFLVYADGSVVAVAPDIEYAENGCRPVTEMEEYRDLLPPSRYAL